MSAPAAATSLNNNNKQRLLVGELLSLGAGTPVYVSPSGQLVVVSSTAKNVSTHLVELTTTSNIWHQLAYSLVLPSFQVVRS